MSIKETQDSRKTCTTIFLLPGIGLHRKDILRYGFLSAYIDDVKHDVHYENSIYLLYRPDNLLDFQYFLEAEKKRTPLLIEDYDYEGGYVVMVYKFPEEYKWEYEQFMKGRYSSFTKKYIALFPKEIEVINKLGNKERQISLQYHIFNRTKAIREFWEEKTGTKLDEDAEMWSSPYLDTKEVLDIDNL